MHQSTEPKFEVLNLKTFLFLIYQRRQNFGMPQSGKTHMRKGSLLLNNYLLTPLSYLIGETVLKKNFI